MPVNAAIQAFYFPNFTYQTVYIKNYSQLQFISDTYAYHAYYYTLSNILML